MSVFDSYKKQKESIFDPFDVLGVIGILMSKPMIEKISNMDSDCFDALTKNAKTKGYEHLFVSGVSPALHNKCLKFAWWVSSFAIGKEHSVKVKIGDAEYTLYKTKVFIYEDEKDFRYEITLWGDNEERLYITYDNDL